eukprot:scpid79452/ scgid32614/ Carbonic anhydrase 2; Carbonate dehydratase II; Carbonic anhydrase C; Carbonic anhydrase II
MKTAFFFAIAVGMVAAASAAAKWSSSSRSPLGPQNWGSISGYELCGTGKSQSPININKASTTYKNHPALSFANGAGNIAFQMMNTGHAINALPSNPDGAPVLSGGPLGSATYRLYNIHIHFGNSTLKSSEHAFENTRTNGEFHIVTYKTTYGNISAAVGSGEAGALAVFGVLFDARNVSNTDSGITTFIDYASNLTYNGDSSTVSLPFPMMATTEDLKTFYTYSGSLTTPGCAEVVTWLVNDRIHYVTPDVMDQLAGLRSGNMSVPSYLLLDNTRPLQMLNGRVVERNFEAPSAASIVSVSLVSALVTIAASLKNL